MKQLEKQCGFCAKSFNARRKYTKYCSRSCRSKATHEQMVADGRWKPYKKGHPNYLKHHSAATKKKLHAMFKGKHFSPSTELKKGHPNLTFKGMHTPEVRKRMGNARRGKRNHMYGKQLPVHVKKAMLGGLANYLRANYGIESGTLKGHNGIPWMDYQLYSEMYRGGSKKELSPQMKNYYRRVAAQGKKIPYTLKEIAKVHGVDLATTRGIEVHIKGKAFILEP